MTIREPQDLEMNGVDMILASDHFREQAENRSFH
jgi:hypothetical protein